MANTMRLTATLIKQYQQLFASCTVLPQHLASVERLTAQLQQQQARYQAVADKTQVPWPVIAVIHALEASQNFHRHYTTAIHCTAAQSMYRTPPTDTTALHMEASAIDALH